MEKKDIFSKFNMKDYNNELEKILEKKGFSSDVKNLFLSMFYKIEAAYQDYAKTKQIELAKQEFMEQLVDLVDTSCDSVVLININQEEEEKFEPKVLKEEKEIISYQNEKDVLFLLLELEQKYFCLPESFAESALQKFLSLGYCMDKQEVIRSFDGWSWVMVEDEINDITANLLYQNLQMLLTYAFMQEWRMLRSQKDFIRVLEKRYGKKHAQAFVFLLLKILLFRETAKDKMKKQKYKMIQEDLEKELAVMKDKEKYVSDISKQKRTQNQEIKKIDEILCNKVRLTKGFEERNERLSEEKKIFSLSDYVETLEKERKFYLEEIKRLNGLVDPKQYTATVEKMSKRVQLLKEVFTAKKEDIFLSLIDLQKEFINCMIDKVDKATTKKEITEILYLLRYYKELPIQEKNSIKKTAELKPRLNQCLNLAITKACKMKLLNVFSNNMSFQVEIIKRMLDTKMIVLENMVVQIKKEETKLSIEIYDEETIEETIEMPLSQKEREMKARENRKLKLFVH